MRNSNGRSIKVSDIKVFLDSQVTTIQLGVFFKEEGGRRALAIQLLCPEGIIRMEGRNSLLSTSPFRDSDPQSHRFIECYQTQDLVSRNEPSLDEWVEDQGGSSSEIVISKLELSVEPCPKKSPSV